MNFELTCHRLPNAVPLAPARPQREIFDRNPHAYRCLPLSTANAAGWELLCSSGFTATWDGGNGKDAIQVVFDDPDAAAFAKSHFCFGILTIETGWLFRTSEGFGLWVMGSPNDPKDGIAPLTGLVESEWLPYPFTMNWQFTRPGSVRFEKGEPFCFITPGPIAAVAACQPEQLDIHEAPETQADLAAWTAERDELMSGLKAGDEGALKKGWGRRYFRGEAPPGASAPPSGVHIHKMRTKAPVASAKASTNIVRRSSPQARDRAGAVGTDGRLTPGSRTRVVRSMAEAKAAGLALLIHERALSQEACQLLCDVYDRLGQSFSTQEHDEFWNGRMLAYGAVRDASPPAAEAMISALLDGGRRVAGHFGLTAPLYADVLNLVGWRDGMFMPVHADDAYEIDGQRVLSHRAYAGLYYLNDDYEGGGLYLPRQDVLIQPSRGMFVALPGDESHEHAVIRIESGRRVTMPFFLTFDAEKAAAALPSPVAQPPKPRLDFGAITGTGDLEFS